MTGVKLAAVIIAASFLAACTGSGQTSGSMTPAGDGHKPTTQPGTSSSPGSVAALRIPPLPLDAYQLTPAQTTTLNRAAAVLAEQCMQQFGFPRYPLPPKTSYLGPDTKQWRSQDPSTGYRAALPTVTPEEQAEFDDYTRYLDEHPKSPEYEAAYYGQKDRSKSNQRGVVQLGDTPPAFGCLGWAESRIAPDDPTLGQIPLVTRLQRQSLDLLDASPAKRAADAEWSSCMAASGFRYKSPEGPPADPRWESTDQPSQAEITTARADIGCLEKSMYIEIWASELSRIQREQLGNNALALAEVPRTLQEDFQRASEALADPAAA